MNVVLLYCLCFVAEVVSVGPHAKHDARLEPTSAFVGAKTKLQIRYTYFILLGRVIWN